jgi:hypothetical protein
VIEKTEPIETFIRIDNNYLNVYDDFKNFYGFQDQFIEELQLKFAQLGSFVPELEGSDEQFSNYVAIIASDFITILEDQIAGYQKKLCNKMFDYLNEVSIAFEEIIYEKNEN